MNRRRLALLGALAVVLAVGAVTAGIAIAAGGDEEALGGRVLAEAKAAAVAHTGGGTVVEAETGEGGTAYEVEVRLDSGRLVEVRLDDRYAVVGAGADDDGPNDRGGANEDDGPNED